MTQSKKGKTPAKSKKSTKVDGAEATEQAPEPVLSEKPAKPTIATFANMARGYLAELEEEGRSESTLKGYRAELKLAASVIGEDRPLDELTAAEVDAFLASDAVTVSRSGSPKSKLSTDRTARVLRQALAWAEEHGLLKTAPLPVEQD